MKKKFALGLISVLLILSLVGCGAEAETADTAAEATVVYEALFLDNDEITDLFESVRGETAPFENVTQDFHVTTEYMPAEAHPEWYGEEVNIHITAYAVQEIEMEDGQMTENEGFKVEVSTDNEELEAYLMSLNKNFHITGAYKDGAKYTEYIDFSEGDPMDVYTTATFGGYYTDGTIRK